LKIYLTDYFPHPQSIFEMRGKRVACAILKIIAPPHSTGKISYMDDGLFRTGAAAAIIIISFGSFPHSTITFLARGAQTIPYNAAKCLAHGSNGANRIIEIIK
jgi:hypothetical protein